MATLDDIALADVTEASGCERANCLEQRVAVGRVRVDTNEAAIHESGERRHWVRDGGDALGDPLDLSQARTAREDGEAKEQRPLIFGEAVVAPGDERLEGALTLRHVARSHTDRGQLLRQPVQDGHG